MYKQILLLIVFFVITLLFLSLGIHGNDTYPRYYFFQLLFDCLYLIPKFMVSKRLLDTRERRRENTYSMARIGFNIPPSSMSSISWAISLPDPHSLIFDLHHLGVSKHSSIVLSSLEISSSSFVRPVTTGLRLSPSSKDFQLQRKGERPPR